MVRQNDFSRHWLLQRRNIFVPLALAGVTIITGSTGVYQQLSSLPTYQASPAEAIVEALLTSLSFFVLGSGISPTINVETPLLVYVSRASGALFFSYAAVLGFGALFAERLKPLRISIWHISTRIHQNDEDGYVVVAGLGTKGFQLANQLLDAGHNVVAIDSGAETSRVRELSDRGAIVLSEDATRPRTIGSRAKVHLASEVFINCGRDRTNARVIRAISDWLENQSSSNTVSSDSTLSCYVHIENRSERHHLQDQFGDSPLLYLHTYDTNHATARELLIRHPVDSFSDERSTGRTHVVLIGWNPLSLATVLELCQTMHYPSGCDRAITIACRDPAAAKRDLYNRLPVLDPDYWEQESTREFISQLFPDISFISLPTNNDVLLSNQFSLYSRLNAEDVLTLIVTENESVTPASVVSTMRPRLEALQHQRNITTTVHYYVDRDDAYLGRTDKTDSASRQGRILSFTDFVDRCTPETVRGTHRDRVAKRIALFFRLRYDYAPAAENPSAIDQHIAERLPVETHPKSGYEYETVIDLWEQLDDKKLEQLSELVWRDLPEHHRDANRYAADHVPVKHRIADALSDDRTTDTIHCLSEIEHRRWCAEKFLDGWEPLPTEYIAQWQHDPDVEDRFRSQKYHLDLLPMEVLRKVTDGEAEKDTSLVRFVLYHLTVADRAESVTPDTHS